MNRRKYLLLLGGASSTTGCLGFASQDEPAERTAMAETANESDESLACTGQKPSSSGLSVTYNTQSFLETYHDDLPVTEIVLGDKTMQDRTIPSISIRNATEEGVAFSIEVSIAETEKIRTETAQEIDFELDFDCELAGGEEVSIVPTITGRYQFRMTTDGQHREATGTIPAGTFRDQPGSFGCTFKIRAARIEFSCGGAL